MGDLGGIKRMRKQILKVLRSLTFPTLKVRHIGGASSSKSYESWNKAKDKLTADEEYRRRRTNACINCGEVGHKSSDSPKPRPRLLESGIDFAVPMPRTHISVLPSTIDESGAIKSNYDYPIDSNEHNLKNTFYLNRKLFDFPPKVWSSHC